MIKCLVCEKKIRQIYVSTQHTCRCGNVYCIFHMSNHLCNYDYKKDHMNKLSVSLPYVHFDKVIHI